MVGWIAALMEGKNIEYYILLFVNRVEFKVENPGGSRQQILSVTHREHTKEICAFPFMKCQS